MNGYEKAEADARARFEAGDYSAVIELFMLLALNGQALPTWLVYQCQQALEYNFEHGGAPGKGKTGGHSTQASRLAVHQWRHAAADLELKMRDVQSGTRDDAFERASEALQGTYAQGSADQIKKSYNKIRALNRPN